MIALATARRFLRKRHQTSFQFDATETRSSSSEARYTDGAGASWISSVMGYVPSIRMRGSNSASRISEIRVPTMVSPQ